LGGRHSNAAAVAPIPNHPPGPRPCRSMLQSRGILAARGLAGQGGAGGMSGVRQGQPRRCAARPTWKRTSALLTLSGLGSPSESNVVMVTPWSDRYLDLTRKPGSMSISILLSTSTSRILLAERALSRRWGKEAASRRGFCSLSEHKVPGGGGPGGARRTLRPSIRSALLLDYGVGLDSGQRPPVHLDRRLG
jgi:hypothetical protein